MGTFLQNLNCCGIKEMAQIQAKSSPEEAIKQLACHQTYDYYTHRYITTTTRWPKNFRFLIFSQAGLRNKYGERMAAFITEKGLGTVTEAGSGINPNSRRRVKVWVWTVDHTATERWLKEYIKDGDAKSKPETKNVPVVRAVAARRRRVITTPRTDVQTS